MGFVSQRVILIVLFTAHQLPDFSTGGDDAFTSCDNRTLYENHKLCDNRTLYDMSRGR